MSILISRFILDLRLVNSQRNDYSMTSKSSFINVASQVLGNIGAPLDECVCIAWYDPDEDGELVEGYESADLTSLSLSEPVEEEV